MTKKIFKNGFRSISAGRKGLKPVEVRIKSEMGVLGDTDFPRLIMSRAGVRPARDIINLGI